MQDDNDRVLKSLTAEGIRLNGLKLANFPGTGRGLATTRPVRKDEILLTIPPKYLLNLKVVGKEFGFDWRKPPVPAHVALAVYILHQEARPESDVAAYIDSLPRQFRHIPLTWSRREIGYLPTSAKAYLRKQEIVFDRHFAKAQWMIREFLPLPDHESITLQDVDRERFQWAWLVVNSRCIYQKLSATSTRDDNYACSPLIDMINHAPSSIPHCKLSYDIKGLSVISTSAYATGQEALISYGAHANEALLCEYGFIVPGNPDNSLVLDHTLDSVLRPHHTMLLMELGYFEDYTVNHRGHPSFRTEVALRTALLAEEDCVEGSRGCRRLTQYVNGQTSGQREQSDVDALLRDILGRELTTAHKMLDRLSTDPDRELVPLIRQLWQDRVDIAEACLARM